MATFSYPLQSGRLKLTYFNKLNGASTIANNAFFGAQANRIDIIVDIVGESITSSHGSPTVSADTNVDVVGSEIITSNGNVSVSADTNVNVTGVDITSASGDVTVSSSIIVDVVGESITSYIGTPTASTDTNVDVTGVDITSASGDVDAFEKYKIDNFIKTEKSKNVFAIQEKELDFIVQNAQILNLMPSEKTLSFDIINKEIKFILENT